MTHLNKMEVCYRQSFYTGMVATFLAAGTCLGQWTKVGGSETITISAGQTNWISEGDVYDYWEQSAGGNVLVSYGSQSVATEVDCWTHSKVYVVNMGDFADSEASGQGPARWNWSGVPGEAPSQLITALISVSGTVKLNGQVHDLWAGNGDSYASANAEATAQFTPRGDHPVTDGSVGAGSWDSGWISHENATLTNQVIGVVDTPDFYGYAVEAEYSIAANDQYVTPPGFGTIAVITSAGCDAHATAWATTIDNRSSQASAEATATASGSASVSFQNAP